MKDIVNNIFDLTYDEGIQKDFPGPIWNDIDNLFSKSFDKFYKLKANERELIISNLNYKNYDSLTFFAYRFSIFGLRDKNVDFLKKSIVSLSIIDYDNCDFREVYILLKMVLYFSLRIKALPEEIFNMAVTYGNSKNKNLFLDFPNKFSTEDLLKNGMSELKEFNTENGIIFLNYFGSFDSNSLNYHNPTIPFWILLYKIGNMISKDEYVFLNVSLNAFKVNFELNLTEKSVKYFKKYFLACGNVSFVNKYDSSQSLELILYELNNVHKANLMEKLVSCRKNKDLYCNNKIICFSFEKYVIVLLATNNGKEDFIENTEKLNRFNKPIREILR